MNKRVIAKKITRVNSSKEFVTLVVTMQYDSQGRPCLSICGVAGDIYSESGARRAAKEFWVSYFEEEPSAIKEMNERCGTNFRSVKRAANYVLGCDGEFHGLEIVDTRQDRNGNTEVFVGHSYGQIREDLLEFFPDVEMYLTFHLNDLRPSTDGKNWEYQELPQFVLDWFESLPTDHPVTRI